MFRQNKSSSAGNAVAAPVAPNSQRIIHRLDALEKNYTQLLEKTNRLEKMLSDANEKLEGHSKEIATLAEGTQYISFGEFK